MTPMTPSWGRREFLASAAAFAAPGVLRRPQEPSVDEFIKATMASSPTPGVAVAVIDQGRLLWSKGYGFATLEPQRPMTPDTIQNVGSVTKTVTATAVMQLAEAGRIDLDADVNLVLPFPVRNPAHPNVPITVRMLLTHTSSIRDGAEYLASYACGDPATMLAVWVAKYLHPVGAKYRGYRHFSAARPGGAWDYSNVGFGLLGVVIEHVSGVSYADYTVRHVFEPLGMTSTGWYLGAVDASRHATPYWHVPKGRAALPRTFAGLREPAWRPADHRAPVFVPHCLYSFPTLPDGLMRTSVNDLARFIGAYQLDGALADRRILRPETIRAIWTPQPLPGSKTGGLVQGLAWYRPSPADPAWQHSGGDPGITTFIGTGANGRGVAVICNAGTSAPEVIGHRLLTT